MIIVWKKRKNKLKICDVNEGIYQSGKLNKQVLVGVPVVRDGGGKREGTRNS